MSIRALAWVWEHSEARGLDRLVLLSIADHADEFGGSAWPSFERIAQRCGISRSSAIRCVGRLVDEGELERTVKGGRPGRGGVSNGYRIARLWVESTAPSGGRPTPPGAPKWSQGGTSSGEELVPTGTEVVSARHSSSSQLTPEPSLTVRTAPFGAGRRSAGAVEAPTPYHRWEADHVERQAELAATEEPDRSVVDGIIQATRTKRRGGAA